MADSLEKQQYELLNCELDEICDKVTESVRAWSRCQQYQEGEQSNNFFLNIEKLQGSQGKVCKLIANNHKINDPQTIEHR